MLPNETPTILLAEDETPVRRLIARILGGRGYALLEAAHGEEALAVSESHPGPIHLLVTDIMMPVMNGRELAARLLALRPGLRVLFLSGYPGRGLPDGLSPEGAADFLAKPFRPEALLARVTALLRRRAGGP